MASTDALPLGQFRDQFHGMLLPWMDALARGARLDFSGGDAADDAQTSQPSIQVEVATDGAVDERVFEAIELLTLASGVDAVLWRMLLAVAWRRLRRWSTRRRTLLESAYKMMQLLKTGDATFVPRDTLVIPVHVRVYGGEFADRVEQLAHVAASQRLRDTESVIESSVFHHYEWSPLFRVVSVDPGFSRGITAKALLHLAHIGSCGIEISRLRVFSMDVESEKASLFARGLQFLLGSTERSSQVSTVGSVRDIELPVYMTERTVTAVFSALMGSQTLRSVAVNT